MTDEQALEAFRVIEDLRVVVERVMQEVAIGGDDVDKISKARMLAFDLETTGLLEDGLIVEYGQVQVSPGGGRYSASFMLNPGVPIPDVASKIHGITDSAVAEARSFFEVAAYLKSTFERFDLVTGYNVIRFDWPMITKEWRACGVEPPNCLLIDPYVFASWHFREKPSLKLEAIYQGMCGRRLEGAHSAEADINATVDVLLAMLEAGFIPDSLEQANMVQAAISAFDDAEREHLGRLFYVDRRDGTIRDAGKRTRGAPAGRDPGYLRWVRQLKDAAPLAAWIANNPEKIPSPT